MKRLLTESDRRALRAEAWKLVRGNGMPRWLREAQRDALVRQAVERIEKEEVLIPCSGDG